MTVFSVNSVCLAAGADEDIFSIGEEKTLLIVSIKKAFGIGSFAVLRGRVASLRLMLRQRSSPVRRVWLVGDSSSFAPSLALDTLDDPGANPANSLLSVPNPESWAGVYHRNGDLLGEMLGSPGGDAPVGSVFGSRTAGCLVGVDTAQTSGRNVHSVSGKSSWQCPPAIRVKPPRSDSSTYFRLAGVRIFQPRFFRRETTGERRLRYIWGTTNCGKARKRKVRPSPPPPLEYQRGINASKSKVV